MFLVELFEYDLADNISLKSAIKSTVNDLSYNAIFAAQWMGDVTSQDNYANGLGISPDNASFTYDDDGSTLAADVELKRADYWYINKQMKNFASNNSVNFDLDKLSLSVGHYFSSWSSDQNWNWSSFLISGIG